MLRVLAHWLCWPNSAGRFVCAERPGDRCDKLFIAPADFGCVLVFQQLNDLYLFAHGNLSNISDRAAFRLWSGNIRDRAGREIRNHSAARPVENGGPITHPHRFNTFGFGQS